MDLLIELIVWIFKALTGENAKDAPNPGGAKPPVPPQRGPYNYGDGRATRPKTLEEILEDVKRQQAQARQPGARPSAPTVSRSAPPPAPARAKVPSLSRPLSEVQPANAPAAAPAPLQQGGAIKSKIETRALAQTLDEKESVKPGLERKFEKISEREDQIGRGVGRTRVVAEVSTMNAIQSVNVAEAGLASRKTNAFAEFFKAMRAAPAEQRADVARRAFVFSEVFGAPRAMRPLRRR
jgi:hypothetical protein